MKKIKNTNFPDQKYLGSLIEHLKQKVEFYQDPLDKLMMYSSAAMNWIADYITDENVKWTKEKLLVDDLYLTGTNPKWNKIIIEQCKRSPKKLKELFNSNKKIKKIFYEAKSSNLPILVRHEKGKLKVFDGMKRVISSIRDGRKTIWAYVVKPQNKQRPKCEPHVIYDLLKAYHKGLNKDKKSLIIALRFLRKSYANVDNLLKERFNKSWVPDDEVQKIIQESLKD